MGENINSCLLKKHVMRFMLTVVCKTELPSIDEFRFNLYPRHGSMMKKEELDMETAKETGSRIKDVKERLLTTPQTPLKGGQRKS
jgi:hypothetical protein